MLPTEEPPANPGDSGGFVDRNLSRNLAQAAFILICTVVGAIAGNQMLLLDWGHVNGGLFLGAFGGCFASLFVSGTILLVRDYVVKTRRREDKPVEARREVAEILRQARELLARPGNDFAWSSWEDGPAAIAELDRRIAAIESGQLPSQLDLAVLFAPTGPIQEVSVISGWAQEFLTVAARFDAAAERLYAGISIEKSRD